jgi:hypothetical protein
MGFVAFGRIHQRGGIEMAVVVRDKLTDGSFIHNGAPFLNGRGKNNPTHRRRHRFLAAHKKRTGQKTGPDIHEKTVDYFY